MSYSEQPKTWIDYLLSIYFACITIILLAVGSGAAVWLWSEALRVR